jgi:hypothetical protein
MTLLLVFAVTVFIGDMIVVAVCAMVEQLSKQFSLILFLFLFMAVFPVAWKIAVRITEPKTPTNQPAS